MARDSEAQRHSLQPFDAADGIEPSDVRLVLKRSDPIPALKQQLAAEVARASRGWTLLEVAGRTGESLPRISAARRGRLDHISLEALIRMLSNMRMRVIVGVVADTGVR